jgi:hypothetical protein
MHHRSSSLQRREGGFRKKGCELPLNYKLSSFKNEVLNIIMLFESFANVLFLISGPQIHIKNANSRSIAEAIIVFQ